MPRFSRFYSATETEALANIKRLFPKSTNHAPQFSNDCEKQLSDLLSGKTVSLPHSRTDTNQPIFCLAPAVRVEQLLDVSSFSVTHSVVHRDKAVRYASSSEDFTEWKTRSQTPSSDDPSPRRTILSPTLSVKVEASSVSGDSLDDDLLHVVEPTMQKREYNLGRCPDYYASYPSNTLQSMDTQFSKWSYDLNEGSTAIPFVMAQAPAETHTNLVKIDRRFWATGADDAIDTTAHADITAAALLGRVQRKDIKHPIPTKRTAQTKKGNDESMTKRAALIAKSKAMKDSSLVVSKSVSQRRSAMHKNKKRRSIMPSPPPTARKPEPEFKAEPPAEQTRPTILILNQGEDDQRREVDSAIQNRRLDIDNSQHLLKLMAKLNRARSGKEEASEGRITELDEGTAEQTEKKRRLKGKARKKAKSGAVR